MSTRGDGAPVDLLVIGGGINGTGIARDAAGRGLSVVLCEQGDLAGGTSSASTKLIHGGLRYLEHYEFRLVREALTEREMLLRAAPHIIWPMRFVLPHAADQRPAWLIRLGLLLYDHLGGRRRLPRSRRINLSRDPVGAALKEEFRTAFSYADCWVEDSRLVVLNAIDAAERGAEILTRTRCAAARRSEGLWYATLRPGGGGRARVVRARALINAAGPWVGDVPGQTLALASPARVRLVKGSHIIVPRLFEGEHAFILQHTDRRVIFVIPYERRYTLIGTTDLPYEGDPATVAIEDDEIAYLCAAVNRYLRQPVTPEQVVWTFAGVRPLHDDQSANPSAVTRDYAFDLDAGDGDEAPLLSIFGGKLTTYRRLAEHALDRLRPELGFDAGPWTAGQPLPGGDLPHADFERFLQDLLTRRNWLPSMLARRYARAYGTRVEALLGEAERIADLGEHLGEGLYEIEIEYLVQHEFAETAEDILWRRSKLGLHVSEATAARLGAWLRRNTRVIEAAVVATQPP
jgi:glycerol-3-phosphate dehydrogenase